MHTRARTILALALFSSLAACTPEPELSVVVSVRRSTAHPVLRTFERETGIKLAATYLEPDAPVPLEFDVLWSGDPESTVTLARSGRLAPLPKSVLRRRSPKMVGTDGRWAAVTADVRVIAYDPRRIGDGDLPTHFEDLLDPRWANKVVLARPREPSAAWHAATMFAAVGAEPAAAFMRDLGAAGAWYASSEREVLDAITGDGPPVGVVAGELAFASREQGNRLGILVPDQDGVGAVLRPTTVAIGATKEDSARALELVTYLLSDPVGRRLALMSSHVALVSGPAPPGALTLRDLVVAQPSTEEIAAQLSAVRLVLADLG